MKNILFLSLILLAFAVYFTPLPSFAQEGTLPDWATKQGDVGLIEKSIPNWVKQNAGWWAEGIISDKEFASALGFLVKEDIITVDGADVDFEGSIKIDDSIALPKWIKNTVQWWIDGVITEDEFKSAIQFMLNEKIISFQEKPIISNQYIDEDAFAIFKINEISALTFLEISKYEAKMIGEQSDKAWKDYEDNETNENLKKANDLAHKTSEANQLSDKASKTWFKLKKYTDNNKPQAFESNSVMDKTLSEKSKFWKEFQSISDHIPIKSDYDLNVAKNLLSDSREESHKILDNFIDDHISSDSKDIKIASESSEKDLFFLSNILGGNEIDRINAIELIKNSGYEKRTIFGEIIDSTESVDEIINSKSWLDGPKAKDLYSVVNDLMGTMVLDDGTQLVIPPKSDTESTKPQSFVDDKVSPNDNSKDIHVAVVHDPPYGTQYCGTAARSCGAISFQFHYANGDRAFLQNFSTLLDNEFRLGGSTIYPTCSWDGKTIELIDVQLKNENDIFDPNDAKFTVNLPCGDIKPERYLIVGHDADEHSKDSDSDNDGLTDDQETSVYKTNPYENDSDGDGLDDFDELDIYNTDPLNADSDGDGLFDGYEIEIGTLPDLKDTDGDFVSDGLENEMNTNPLHRDSDGDGIEDAVDTKPLQKSFEFFDATIDSETYLETEFSNESLKDDSIPRSHAVGRIIDDGGHSIRIYKIDSKLGIKVGTDGGEQTAIIDILNNRLELGPGTITENDYG